MAKTHFTSVDDYLATRPADVRAVLRRVRSVIRKALPRAKEVISYQIPAYKLPEGTVLYFAGWKEHFSIYPATRELVAKFKDDLAGYTVSKGTIRFPLSEPVPEKLVARLAKFKAKEAIARAQAKVPASKGRTTKKKRP